MNKKHIIFVPGKNPKPPAEQHRDMLWRTLLEGIRRAEPDIAINIEQYKDNFHLVAWNHAFYQKSRDTAQDLPWIDALLNQHGPTQQDMREASSWLLNLSRGLYNLADHLPWLIHWLPEATRKTIEETNHYFENSNNIGYVIRGILKNILRPILKNNESVLIIGHSLGSVIIYDTLWELSHNETHSGKVDFFSLGSPLGLKFVQNKLQGRQFKKEKKFPDNIRHWTNLSSVGDITAVDRCIKDDFSDMLKYELIDSIEDHCEGIYNFYRDDKGLNCHRSYGYLVNPAVGEIIAEWWKENTPSAEINGEPDK